MLLISVQTLSHLLGKITKSSLRLSYLEKVEHKTLIPRRTMIVEHSIETKKICEMRNIV